MELSPILLICIVEMLGCFLYSDTSIMMTTSFFSSMTAENLLRLHVVYSNSKLFFSLAYFLVADGIRYRSIIILGSISALLKYAVLFLPQTLFLKYIMMISQAFCLTSIKATIPYILSIEDRSKYQKITAYVNVMAFSGLFFRDIWIRFFMNNVDLEFVAQTPIYIHAITLCIVLPCSYILPPVDSKRSNDAEAGIENLLEGDMDTNADARNKEHILGNLRTNSLHLWNNFKTAYTNYNVLKWSVWYSTTACMAPLVRFYGSLMLDHSPTFGSNTISVSSFVFHTFNWIGYVITMISLIWFSLKPTNWETKGDLVLGSVSFILSGLTVLQYFYLHQLFHLIIMEIFRIISDVFLCICLWEIVQIIPRNSFALVLGLNVFVGQILRKISPFPDVFSDHLNIKDILFHAALFAALGLWFAISAKSSIGKSRG